MPAFSMKRYGAIMRTIHDLCQRRLMHKRCDLTHEDALALWVRPEHHRTLIEITELVPASVGNWGSLWARVPVGDTTIQLLVHIHDQEDRSGFLMPHYAGKEIFAHPESEPYRKLLAWVNWRLKVAEDWGLTQAVFETLYHRCDTLAEMRFIWPGIVSLLKHTEGCEKAADSVQEYRVPANIPRVEPELREACQRTAGAIAQALLLPKIGDWASIQDEVSLSLSGSPFRPIPWKDGRAGLPPL